MKYETPQLADNKKIYQDRIKELMTEVKTICSDHGLPFLALFAIGEKDSPTSPGKMAYKLEMEAMLPEQFGLSVDDPIFHNIINLMNGFKVVPRATEVFDDGFDDSFNNDEFVYDE